MSTWFAVTTMCAICASFGAEVCAETMANAAAAAAANSMEVVFMFPPRRVDPLNSDHGKRRARHVVRRFRVLPTSTSACVLRHRHDRCRTMSGGRSEERRVGKEGRARGTAGGGGK